jgi:hypothetical protein
MGRGGQLIPASHAEWFTKGFAAYNRRLLRKRFHAVRAATGSCDLLRQHNEEPLPLILTLNHAAWWDPLIIIGIASLLLPSRRGIAPIDAAQLRRFAFFRKLGLFGIDPDELASLTALLDYAVPWLQSTKHSMLALTTQGRFTDVREPIVNRPGAAAVAARLGANGCTVLSIAIEYGFWQDQRPEVFIRAAKIDTPKQSTTSAWHRAIQNGMQTNTDELARRVIARHEQAFETLLGNGTAKINPVYDLWLRLRGRHGAVQMRRSAAADSALQGPGSHTP